MLQLQPQQQTYRPSYPMTISSPIFTPICRVSSLVDFRTVPLFSPREFFGNSGISFFFVSGITLSYYANFKVFIHLSS
ncbi:MAG: hypothetical protein COV85_03165 [Candidatus Portnoybacteria bacterium CG11_big_fil_rev_8_21_14_0_20_44_10]|uniref:Uncharacterized protein n=1 Tax=Candidatus Portnoybacteria bacterium CG11_big_fil_rev_8_21_14_0_20_44_10 TaxID=1974818 RepID=A0A2H0KQ20_9BACT|nr:MAG: hypothetical protein COV85_03165 [Candidatus Portnoybacteria bacterium CG11_big_fil_rev_8_21_14_0_20_44_10]